MFLLLGWAGACWRDVCRILLISAHTRAQRKPGDRAETVFKGHIFTARSTSLQYLLSSNRTLHVTGLFPRQQQLQNCFKTLAFLSIEICGTRWRTLVLCELFGPEGATNGYMMAKHHKVSSSSIGGRLWTCLYLYECPNPQCFAINNTVDGMRASTHLTTNIIYWGIWWRFSYFVDRDNEENHI